MLNIGRISRRIYAGKSVRASIPTRNSHSLGKNTADASEILPAMVLHVEVKSAAKARREARPKRAKRKAGATMN